MIQSQKIDQLILSDGKIITKGEIFKVSGEYGLRFKFDYLVVTDAGATWVDCFEMFRGMAGAYRSFSPSRIKRIPKKRKSK